MPRYAANLTMTYTEFPFLERFAAAAEDGFKGVEYMFPYEAPAAEVGMRLRDAGLTQALFNAPAGDWAAGERGLAVLPERVDDFRRGFEKALEYAAVLGNRLVHVMAGLRRAGEEAAQREVYVRNLSWAAGQAASAGLGLVIEPINGRDMPGYFLNGQAQALAVIEDVGADNLALLFDLYHCQIVEGDLAMKMRANFGKIAHMQIAGAPQRHEPDTGEVNYPYLMQLADELGYDGWVGGEYRPRAGTRAGLGWVRDPAFAAK